MPDRRFRDMRLTESDVEERIHANIELCERKIRWDCDHLGVGDEPDTSELVAFVDRAKRLLPLWRDIGLRDHYERGAMDVLEELGLKGK